MRPRGAVAVALAVLLAGACSGDGDGAPPTTSTTTSTTEAPGETTTTAPPPEGGTLDQVDLVVEQVAALERPTTMAARPSSTDLYVGEKNGRIRVIDVTEATSSRSARYQLLDTPILDLSDEVTDQGTEQGLLGLAFSTDGRKLYVSFTAAPDGASVLLEYQLGDRSSVDMASRRELLRVEQPYQNHNGGHLVMGADGYLYVGLGDGGSGGDPHGNGQDPTTLLGSILRIDPEGGAESGPPYAIPPGNPFAEGAEAAPETWLFGVRNPWRFSFDRATGDLWVADVGQDDREEINRLPATGGFDAGRGANLGWNEMEGSAPYDGGENPEGAVLPIHEYTHEEGGCSVTGGYVYRGDAIGPLQGAYLFGDYCAPGLRAIQVYGDTVVDDRRWDLPVEGLQSFGEDNDGELFLLLADGRVLKVVPA